MSVFPQCASRKVLLLSASALAFVAMAPAAVAQDAVSRRYDGQRPALPSTPPSAQSPTLIVRPAPTPYSLEDVNLGRPATGFRSLTTPQGGDIAPAWGDIEAFWGDINPFWGDINPFWGDINPFWRDINPFWGDINPFWGDINAFWGDINAFEGGAGVPGYADVGAYWTDVGSLWTDTSQKWNALGAYAAGAADYAQVQTQLNDLVTRSEATWGAAVTAKTGQSFREGFADAILAKHGIDLDDPSSLEGMTAAERSHFFMDWYDGLMGFSGVDRVDHWMATVHWTPQLTQIQGSGGDAVIGLLDMTVAGDPDIANNISASGGFNTNISGHGTGVASLMVAAHDGHGVMGFAPNARVVAYNPFDSSGTASWDDVRSGIIALRANGAGVINMSLGVAGWTLHEDWKDALAGQAANTLFVIAAGNAGVTQTADVEWNWAQDPAILVVGSVDPGLNISSFSNRPGTACLLDNGVCTPGHELYNRFLVAPGELILVSDGQGGVQRHSGTSFAAPLVSGAIALLQDRWPWLKSYPHETADIILRSAHDLGAPGPDPVYGWGLLDVAASQSPLDFNALTFYEYRDGAMTQRSASEVKSGGLDTTWEADGVFFRLFEPVGATHRDFAVPMSSRLVGQKSNVTGSEEYFQSYVHARMADWITGASGFTDVVTHVSQAPGQWSFAVSTGLPPMAMGRDELASQAPHMAVRMGDPTGRFAFSVGRGEGAMVLGQMAGFAQTRDYMSGDGGVNPILGFASGGPFANAEFAISNRTTLSFGGAERQLVHRLNPALSDSEREMLRGVDDYRAGAVNVRLTHKVSETLSLNAGYARLKEANGLLGVQSTEADDLGRGAVSHVASVGASLELPHRLTFAASASTGQTRSADPEQQNLKSVGALRTSAYAVSLTKQGLLGKQDLVRFAFTQPLTVESGKLAFTSVEVIDRKTGEIGPVTQVFDISARPRHVAEALYAAPVFEGAGQVSLFGRAEFTSDAPVQDWMTGVRLNLNY